MATEDPTSSVPPREVQVAKDVAACFKLAPPVDLTTVADAFVDLEFKRIPGDKASLLMNPESSRPRVLIQAAAAEVRQRFTLAHQLGHVLLPWHAGAVPLCSSHASSKPVDRDGGHREGEANRFAGELLVPRAWLTNQIARLKAGRVAPIREVIAQAKVSAQVASLRLLEVLPPGHVFAIVDARCRVELAGKSSGTRGVVPERGSHLDRRRLDQFASLTEDVRYGNRRLIWWSFRAAVHDGQERRVDDASPVILDRLLDMHSSGAEERSEIVMSLAGIIGSAKNTAIRQGAPTRAGLYSQFRLAFAKPRPLPAGLLDDPNFDRWLRGRADELASL